MKKAGIVIILTFLFCFLFCLPSIAFAQSDNPLPAITVINSVRGNGLGHEGDDLAASLRFQWQITMDAQVHATWLMQYGALENKQMIDLAIQEMEGQEFGLLFEIDRNFAEKSHVAYRGQGAWYFSDGLFLNSYDIRERRRLIDTAFLKFKEVFGYYPKTVGAWWIGGDSLSYMQKKYGISAALRAADQFDLDFYSLWGTPWSVPYLASVTNEAIPAQSYDKSSKVVILQWAARDPLEGYRDPIFSLQDYSLKGYGDEYVDYLSGIFLRTQFQNLVFGLENGGMFEDLNSSYKPRILKARELEIDKKATIILAKDFSRQFLEQRKVFPYPRYFLSKDYDSEDQSFWYLSENYRAAVQKNNEGIYVVDIKDYSKKVDEDFSILPNSQPRLRITTPDVIDSVRFPDRRITLRVSSSPITIQEQGEEVTLYTDNDALATFNPVMMKLFPADVSREQVYEFKEEKLRFSLLSVITGVFFLYVLIVFLKKGYSAEILRCLLPLVVPIWFASSYLINQSVFLFDTKEIVLLYAFFPLRVFSVYHMLILVKIIPIIVLIVLHYVYHFMYPNRITKHMYFIGYILISFLYLSVPYFPLDKTTGMYVGAGLIISVLSAVVLILSKQHVPIRNRLLLLGGTLIVFISLSFVIVYSRSKMVITNYEISALEYIKNSRKNVIYVEQFDNSIKPIYKAMKPLLYTYGGVAPMLTGKKWKIVARPENNILQLSDYDDFLIVIPAYLGSDISGHEIQNLRLKKIFDNAHILIFEKE